MRCTAKKLLLHGKEQLGHSGKGSDVSMVND
ncbi:hypothetical protein METH_17155 [Leisingera methylohalidivorans DSM 14336]|uniref:Uncharacterized protein n=1 Tax=Leisingera methylohalidivorans DSM 14336 TaxID=999552 RepID=V9VZ60_9RHOB|nr:hypothetical protein METH_17155 [Leisingera methylohalidivorans DSM 14336]